MTKHFGTTKASLWFLSALSVKFHLSSWAVFIALKVHIIFQVHYLLRTHSLLVLLFNTVIICLCLPLIFYSKCLSDCIEYLFCKWCWLYLKLLWEFVGTRGEGFYALDSYKLGLSNIVDNNHGSVELEDRSSQFLALQLSNSARWWQAARCHGSQFWAEISLICLWQDTSLTYSH